MQRDAAGILIFGNGPVRRAIKGGRSTERGRGHGGMEWRLDTV